MVREISNSFIIGIDEILSGNENKIISCMPIIKLPDDRLAVARDLDWDFEGNGLRIATIQELEENVTLFNTQTNINIKPFDLAILIGPLFYKILLDLKIHFIDQLEIFDVNNGFNILIMNQSEYEEFSLKLAHSTKEIFDLELENTLSSFLTINAKNALKLLIGNPATSPEDYYTRILCAAKVEGNSDDFRNYLEISILELGKHRNIIETWVKDYLSDRIRQGEIRIKKSDTIASEQLPALPIELELLKPFKDISVDQHYKIHERAYNLIERLWVEDQRYLNGPFKEMWHEILKNVFSLDNKQTKIASAYLLKKRTEILAKHVWSHRKIDWLTQFSKFSRIQQLVNEVDRYAKEMGISSLIYGLSQFPEARILGELCKFIFDELDWVIAVKHRELKYGTSMTIKNNEADLVLQNELTLNRSQKRTSKPIFTHEGYFVFINRKQIMKYLTDDYSGSIKDICNKMLNKTESNSDFTNEELNARCWMALDSGLKSYSFVEYDLLIKSIEKSARNLDSFEVKSSPSRNQEFDEDFESFISGESNVFLGGSIHARLLLNWWNNGLGEYFVVLYPNHFSHLLSELQQWPPSNRLILSKRIISSRSRSASSLKDSLNQLFTELAKLVDEIAHESKDDENSSSRKFIQYLMSILSHNRDDIDVNVDPWRWSFVADEESMHSLLLEDNNFNIT